MGLSKRMFKHISSLMVMNGRVGLEVAAEWAEEVVQLEAALIEIRPKQAEAVEMMKANGFVIDDLDDRWQKLAFTLYNYLVEIRSIADIVLGGES